MNIAGKKSLMLRRETLAVTGAGQRGPYPAGTSRVRPRPDRTTVWAKSARGRHTAKNSGAQTLPPPAPAAPMATADSYDPDTATISSQESDPPPTPPPPDTSQIAKTSADSRDRGRRSKNKINKLGAGAGAGQENGSRPTTRAHAAKLLRTRAGAETEPGTLCRAETGVEVEAETGPGEAGRAESPPPTGRDSQHAADKQQKSHARRRSADKIFHPQPTSTQPPIFPRRTDARWGDWQTTRLCPQPCSRRAGKELPPPEPDPRACCGFSWPIT